MNSWILALDEKSLYQNKQIKSFFLIIESYRSIAALHVIVTVVTVMSDLVCVRCQVSDASDLLSHLGSSLRSQVSHSVQASKCSKREENKKQYTKLYIKDIKKNNIKTYINHIISFKHFHLITLRLDTQKKSYALYLGHHCINYHDTFQTCLESRSPITANIYLTCIATVVKGARQVTFNSMLHQDQNFTELFI